MDFNGIKIEDLFESETFEDNLDEFKYRLFFLPLTGNRKNER